MDDTPNIQELEQAERVSLEINESSFSVDKGACPVCEKNLTKYIETRSLFDGSLTFHLIKFKCEICKKEYLDLNQAEKYDIYLKLEHLSQEKSLDFLSHCLSAEKVSAE